MVVDDWFSKMAHFMPCNKTLNATRVVDLYFLKIVRLNGIPKNITSNSEVKFMSHFFWTLWRKLETQLQFTSAGYPQTYG